MADSTCICLGTGFVQDGIICILHLNEAFLSAMSVKDMEMAGVILQKQRTKK